MNAPPTAPDRAGAQRGFTLTELLVVLAVLGILVALIVASVGDLVQWGHEVICASRLHSIAVAYQNRAADTPREVVRQPISYQYAPAGSSSDGHTNAPWAVALLGYVDRQTLTYVCPEGSRSAVYTVSGSGPPAEVADDVVVSEYAFLNTATTPYDPALTPGPVSQGTDADHNQNPGGDYPKWGCVPMDPNCYRVGIRPYVNGQPAEFTQDLPAGYDWTTAEVFELTYEALWDYDWNDIVLRITRNADGSVLVECVGFESNGYYNVLDGVATPLAALPEFLNTCWTCQPPPTQRSAVLLPRGHGGEPDDGQDTDETFEIETSYGINAVAHKLDTAQKVLMVEYHKDLADVVGPAATDDWSEQVAPRHRGKCHVLFVDGSVQLVDPADIDPTNAAHHDRYWKSADIPPMTP